MHTTFLNERYKMYIKIEIKKDKMKIKTIIIFKERVLTV